MTKQQRPRPACLNCQVDSYQAKVLKGRPYLASYGLQAAQLNARAGSYKAPTFIKESSSMGMKVFFEFMLFSELHEHNLHLKELHHVRDLLLEGAGGEVQV